MKNKNLIWWVIGGIILLGGGAVTVSKLTGPKGIRNNNPGNIRISNAAWQGKVPLAQNTDGQFEQFVSMQYGVRAMLKNMITHINNGYNTPFKLINKWAPGHENDVLSYVYQVVSKTGIGADEKINTSPEYLQPLAMAIARHENGTDVITPQLFNEAWALI